MFIPHILHQTWKTKRLSPVWRTYQKKLLDLHPQWEYWFWTDEDNRRLVQKLYPHLLRLYDSLPLPVNRADMVRYLYLHAYGGVYLDIDYEVIHPLDPLLKEYELVLPYGRQLAAGDEMDQLGNCVMASRPRHPFWLQVIATLPERLQEAERRGLVRDAIWLSGPALVTEVGLAQGRALKGKTSLPEREIFHPYYHPGNESEYSFIIEKGQSVGVHHCYGSWMLKENPFRLRVRRLVRLLKHPMRTLV